MLEQPQAGLIGRFYRQVENRPKNPASPRTTLKRGPMEAKIRLLEYMYLKIVICSDNLNSDLYTNA